MEPKNILASMIALYPRFKAKDENIQRLLHWKACDRENGWKDPSLVKDLGQLWSAEDKESPLIQGGYVYLLFVAEKSL